MDKKRITEIFSIYVEKPAELPQWKGILKAAREVALEAHDDGNQEAAEWWSNFHRAYKQKQRRKEG